MNKTYDVVIYREWRMSFEPLYTTVHQETNTLGNLFFKFLPAWKSMPTAKDVPETGTRASDLSDGSRGIPRMPSCTEYRRKEPTPAAAKHNSIF